MSKQADSLGFEQDAKPENVVWHRHAVDKAQRATLKQQRPAVLWFSVYRVRANRPWQGRLRTV